MMQYRYVYVVDTQFRGVFSPDHDHSYYSAKEPPPTLSLKKLPVLPVGRGATRHCCYGVCNSDSRYADREHMQGVTWLIFPKPHLDAEKCRRWVAACSREGFTTDKVTRWTYICSKHFVGGHGPTEEHPYPIPATGCSHTSAQCVAGQDSNMIACKSWASAGQHSAATNCYNNRRKCPVMTFHRFPKARCKHWAVNSRRPDLLDKSTAYLQLNCVICRVHFEDNQYLNAQDKTRLTLIHSAVPTIFDVHNPPPSTTCRKRILKLSNKRKRPTSRVAAEQKTGGNSPQQLLEKRKPHKRLKHDVVEAILQAVPPLPRLRVRPRPRREASPDPIRQPVKPADKSCEKRVECFHSDCNHVQGQDTCKFFMWPTDEESLTKWQIVSDRRPDCKRDANSRLCSCHFEKHKKANGPTIYKPINSGPMTFKVVKQRKILASPHRKSRKVKRLPTEANLEFNQLGETSQMQFDDDVFPQADCKDSALTAMDGSLDSGYTISVKTEEEKADLLTEQTLQIIEPRHWTVNDRGVLVNADESEVAIKLEKPDWTIENVMADCSTIMAGQGDGESKDGILIAKEEDSLSSDPHEIAVGH